MPIHPMHRLLDIMARLRDPQSGCPWDLEQDFTTIAPHTIEEAYEVVEAIESGDLASLRDELGDLLFQVVFYAQMAKERGAFDFAAVADAIADKMVRRHPHVFGDADIDTAAAQSQAWEAQKERERQARGQDSVLAGVSTALPALTRALKLQKRAARVGFDWADALPALDKIVEEATEIKEEILGGALQDRLEDELGDLLFACVNVARKLNIDPEAALRRGNRKFERRFHQIEDALAKAGRRPAEATLAEMDVLWEAAKCDERDNTG